MKDLTEIVFRYSDKSEVIRKVGKDTTYTCLTTDRYEELLIKESIFKCLKLGMSIPAAIKFVGDNLDEHTKSSR